MPTADDYAAAFVKEHEAGNREKAQIFADAYREALAEEQGGQQPAAPTAPPPAAPQQPEADTYLTRSLDGLKRGASSVAGMKDGLTVDNFVTGAKALAQGVPFIGPATDNLYAKANSAITGRNEEEVRQEYMAPVEAMNPYVRAGVQVGGGAASMMIPGVGPLVKYAATRPMGAAPIIGAIESLITGPWRRDNGKPAIGDMVEHGVADATVGALGGAGGVAAAKALSLGGQGLENAVRTIRGKPLSPFRGRGAAAAQKRVAEAVRDNAPLTPVRTDVPLLKQPVGARLGREVFGDGGENAGKVAAAARETMADKSAMEAAGETFQKLGIVQLGRRTAPEEVAKSATVSSDRIADILGNPDMKKIVERTRRDLRFEGVPNLENNLTFVHEVNVRLAKAAGKAKPVKAENMQVLRAALSDAIDDVAPGYKNALSRYRAAAAETASAREMAKAAGGAAKYIKGEDSGRMFNVGNTASGTPQGMKFRAITNLAAHLTEKMGLSHEKQTNAIIARILQETDPEQIAAMFQAMKKPAGGIPYRPATVFQGNNALLPWRDEEAR